MNCCRRLGCSLIVGVSSRCCWRCCVVLILNVCSVWNICCLSVICVGGWVCWRWVVC